MTKLPCTWKPIATAVTIVMLCILGMSIAHAETSAGPYKLGPEDVITVTVARHADFSGDYYIPADGVINLPSVGQLQAGGKTLDELAVELKTRLGERLRDPEVTVSLRTARMQRVYVLGSVANPGLFDVKTGWRITEAIAAAGGLAKGVEPSDCCATILRASTGNRENVKLSDVFAGDSKTNLAIGSGDVVTINAEETMPIYVMGKVKTPGLYRVRKDSASVMAALTLAGGVSDDAAISRATITHINGESLTLDLTPALLDGKQDSTVKLQAGDVVVIPEETGRVAVLGLVNEPGFYPLKSGVKLTLSDAIGMAKGADPKRGKLGAVAIIRTEGGKQKRLVCDLSKFLKSGDMRENPQIMPGDVVFVPSSNKPDWGTILSAMTSVGLLVGPL